jgi:hypothetical protein
MLALTEDLGRLVYRVEMDPMANKNMRRGGGARRIVQSLPPSSSDPNSSAPHLARAGSSDDDDSDSAEQTLPFQQAAVRAPAQDRARFSRRRTSSDDSATHSSNTSIPTSLPINRVRSID